MFAEIIAVDRIVLDTFRKSAGQGQGWLMSQKAVD